MASVTLKDLLEAGAHFGHQTQRWNPKMKRFILCPKNGIHIIDLNKTIVELDKFIAKVRSVTSKGGKVLFVGTKKQVKSYIKEEAERCGMPYVTERWLGGMLTNFSTIRESVKRLEKIEKMEADGTFEKLPKKEIIQLTRQKEKLTAVLGGIRNIRKSPELVFVVDTLREHLAVAEARRLGIPVAAIADTNSNPDELEFPIPANDDAIKSVKVITGKKKLQMLSLIKMLLLLATTNHVSVALLKRKSLQTLLKRNCSPFYGLPFEGDHFLYSNSKLIVTSLHKGIPTWKLPLEW